MSYGKENCVDATLERTCSTFLMWEAQCLDDRQFEDWLALLDPEIEYKAPVRTTRENWDGEGLSDTAFWMEEDFRSLETRVKRLASRFAWSENPATRTRRFVGNIRVLPKAGTADVVTIRSNLAIFCHRGEAPQPQVITADRIDEVRIGEHGLKILKRTVILDTAVLGLESLSIFL
jgi:3-phenylpropionate/cinnamic acid dioxygenase small subunit